MANCVCFIHAALLSRVEERLHQYLFLMKISGLLDQIKHVYIDCVGEGDLPKLAVFEGYPITVTRVDSHLEANEFPTHSHLWNYALENPETYILYLHTKGVGKDINPAIEDWVAYMTYFLIEKWSVCVNQLDSNKSVGVDLRPEFHLHYSGNFWWARADYLCRLPDPYEFCDLSKYPNAINSKRHAAEFWLCSDGTPVGHVNLWSSFIPVGQRHVFLYPRSMYAKDQ